MYKKNKKPVKNKLAKVPVILQLEALECGAACLAMILSYYNKWVPLEQVRIDCGVSRNGSNAKNILSAGRHYGLTSKGYKVELEDIVEYGEFPCIVHWNFNHFVVLNGFKKNKAVINDPARGVVEISMEEFDNAFTGICLMFEPSEDFVEDGNKKRTMDFIRKNLNGTKEAMTFTVIISFITSIISMINPMFSRIFVDNLITGLNPTIVYPFFIFLIMFISIQIIMSGLNSVYSLKIQGRLAIKSNASYMWHVLRMPVEFFSQRMAGDIAERKSINETIALNIINTFAPIMINIMMMFFYIIVIFKYSVLLSIIGIIGMAINISINQYIVSKKVNISRVAMRDMAKLSSTTVSGIDMIESIKSSGAENGFFQKWSGYQASVNNHNIESLKVDIYMGMIPKIVSLVINIIILYIGLYMIIIGNFTVGMLFAFQSMLNSLMMPIEKLSNVGTIMKEMRINMERIDDVMEYPADVEYQKENKIDISYDKLVGRIELKNVTFGYSKMERPIIENFSMKVEPGEKIAFVGGSGCGKSTLSKLISGLYKPWSGEILFNGNCISEIDRNIFTGSLAVVDQNITLFEDTISNNIKMWDSSIEDYEMIMAARDANIHDDIMQRENGYNYRIMEDGKDFSGGQRQRIEIARVLAQDPTVIIMDEATSALDAKTEYKVVNAIKNRGITCILIAHRLSTIRDCDEIIVMERGRIVERGKHEYLMNLHGRYEELIMSE